MTHRVAHQGILLFFAVTAMAWTDAWYESNASGIRVAPISESLAGEYAYVLVVEEGEMEQTQRLLYQGNETRQIVTLRSGTEVEETTYENGVKTSSVRYADGFPVEERFYSDGLLRERSEFTYLDGKLTKIATYDGEDRQIESIVYQRVSDGRISRSELKTEGGSQTTLYRFDESGLYESWLGDEFVSGSGTQTSGTLYRYDGEQLIGVERWNGDRLIRLETYEPTASGRRHTIKEFDSGRTVIRNFGLDGTVREESVMVGDSRVEQTRYRYVGGLLIESTRVHSGGSEQHRYVYDSDGALMQKAVSVNALLQKIVVWTGGSERYEEIYRNGKPILRIYFDGDRKVSEEMIP